MENFRDFFNRYHEFGRFGLMMDREESRILEEGLITSYPSSSVLSMLSQTYGDVITHIQSDIFKEGNTTAGISIFFRKGVVTREFSEQLNNKLKVYGYFIAFEESYNDEEDSMFIEPKYSFLIEPKNIKNRRCFHITHKKYLPKIQEIGLVPKNSQTHFNFDGSRIFFMFSDDEKFIQKFKTTLARSKKWEVDHMITLEILNLNNKKIYFDMNFGVVDGNVGAFTLDNIHKNDITIIN